MKRAAHYAWIAVLLLAIAVVVMAIARVGQRLTRDEGDVPAQAMIGTLAPDFTLPLIGGQTVSLSQQRGKVVVLDFWAVWCPPCIHGMPISEKIVERYADQGVELITVNMTETPEQIEQFVRETGIRSKMAVGAGTDVGRAYQVGYIPQMAVIDRAGVLHAVEALLPDQLEDWLPKAIESALKTGQASR